MDVGGFFEFNFSDLNHRLVIVGDIHCPENDVTTFYFELSGFNHGAVYQREFGVGLAFYFGYGQPLCVSFVGTAGGNGSLV